MRDSALLLLLLTSITSTCLAAGCVVALFRRGSASTRRAKPPSSPPETPPSEAALAALAADQAELFSTLSKLTTTVKRLSSRQGLQDVRAREATAERTDPPRGTPKAELLRHYGMSGKVGPAFAQAQLDIEARNETEH